MTLKFPFQFRNIILSNSIPKFYFFFKTFSICFKLCKFLHPQAFFIVNFHRFINYVFNRLANFFWKIYFILHVKV